MGAFRFGKELELVCGNLVGFHPRSKLNADHDEISLCGGLETQECARHHSNDAWQIGLFRDGRF
jgi:hypothetical protein